MVKIYVRGSRVIAPNAIPQVGYCIGSKSLVLVCRGLNLIWNFKASHSTFCSSCHFTTHSSFFIPFTLFPFSLRCLWGSSRQGKSCCMIFQLYYKLLHASGQVPRLFFLKQQPFINLEDVPVAKSGFQFRRGQN